MTAVSSEAVATTATATTTMPVAELRAPPASDCLGCRITGSGVALGVAGYSLYEMRRVQPVSVARQSSEADFVRMVAAAARDAHRHRIVLGAMAAVFGTAGVYRLLM
ncbi:hypothetical protein DFJ73DRAFT_772488 [Zopfochytrium polystomum]|nr:hypothetical protein DFJ73DRAFT_772488 [Zopfochytrium polystomum]